jgi:para-aminobenzoate synthetase/4-amino-4-deoxychorismate lyase
MTAVDDRIEALIQDDEERWLFFERPVRVIDARDVAAVAPAIAMVEALTRDEGLHAVGFVTYEAGAAFGLRVHPPPPGLPLAWFAVFDTAPTPLRHLSEWGRTGVRLGSDRCQIGVRPLYQVLGLAPSIDRSRFEQAFARIKRHIADGETYQVNYTFRLEGRFTGDPRALFADLVAAQRGRHGVFLRAGDLTICSASPELFFARTGSRLTARPMKGTARRGRSFAEDLKQRDELRASPKQQAENVMIVDMMRNDMGRIAEFGSVDVPDLLTVERYPTVWQMTSVVTARSRARLDEIFAALHPSASVTGAPKVRTMEILSEIEAEPRGIYTGALGYVRPGGDARFNVAIRTAVVDEARGTVTFGIGSGIVWDSDATDEYEECLLKAAVLDRRPPQFELLETMRWTPGQGFFLLQRHLQRLSDSADYFGFVCRPDEVMRALDETVAGGETPLRVRLLVDSHGRIRVERAPLQASPSPLRVGLAVDPIDPADTFLYHKTTNRAVYERARRTGLDDVILWNPKGEVTEATIANIVVEMNGSLVTPPIDCGLLAGTFRAELLESGEVHEATVSVKDITRPRRLWLVNSVQEWRPAVLVAE